MKFALCLIFILFTQLGFAKKWTAIDSLRSAVAMREAIAHKHGVAKVFEVEKGIIFDEDFSECISLIVSKIPNTICPDDEWVGPFLTKASMTCFKKGTEQEVKIVSMMESQCDKPNFKFRSEKGIILEYK